FFTTFCVAYQLGSHMRYQTNTNDHRCHNRDLPSGSYTTDHGGNKTDAQDNHASNKHPLVQPGTGTERVIIHPRHIFYYPLTRLFAFDVYNLAQGVADRNELPRVMHYLVNGFISLGNLINKLCSIAVFDAHHGIAKVLVCEVSTRRAPGILSACAMRR